MKKEMSFLPPIELFIYLIVIKKNWKIQKQIEEKKSFFQFLATPR